MNEFTESLKTQSIAEMLELCMIYAAGAVNARLDPKLVWDYREKIQAMRREILTRAASWEKAAIARPEIEGARDLAFELGADICSDHCDLDPEDNQHMAHCHWCDQATRVYQMLKAALGASPRPATKEPEPHPLKDFFTGESHACVTGWNMIGSKADCKDCNPGAKGFPEPEQKTPGDQPEGGE